MNAFNWQGQPSAILQSLKPHPMARDLAPKRLNVYQEATVSDASREAEIAQTNREVEYHFALAQKVTDAVMKGYHRDEARRLAMKVKALVQARSPGYVARLEQERGLA